MSRSIAMACVGGKTHQRDEMLGEGVKVIFATQKQLINTDHRCRWADQVGSPVMLVSPFSPCKAGDRGHQASWEVL